MTRIVNGLLAGPLLGFVALAMPTGALAQGNPDVLCVQTEFQTRGFDPGPLDGQMGGRTRAVAEQIATNQLPPLSPETAALWCANMQLAAPLAVQPLMSDAEIADAFFGHTLRFSSGTVVRIAADGAGIVSTPGQLDSARTYSASEGRLCSAAAGQEPRCNRYVRNDRGTYHILITQTPILVTTGPDRVPVEITVE